jgi:hypothetical protein
MIIKLSQPKCVTEILKQEKLVIECHGGSPASVIDDPDGRAL